MSIKREPFTRRIAAFILALCLLAPLAALPAQAQQPGRNPNPPANQRPGMSTGKKVALVAGAALLYYLYRKHTASQQAQNATTTPGRRPNATATARRPQLYRSKNGGIYYRDPQGKPVWLTVPNRPVEVPLSDLQRYAPDYQRYRGPAPAAPSGYRTQPYTEFDPSMARAFGGGSAPSAPAGGPPGPRGN